MNVSAPTASVVIPCYNNEEFVAAAIESALGQTYPNVEVVIVNDGSTDSSAAIIEQYKDRTKVIHQMNAGACVARNRGIAESKGNWIKFLDADDVLTPDCLAIQIEIAKEREIIVFGDCELMDEVGRPIPHPSHEKTNGLEAGALADLDTFVSSLVLISTTLFPRRLIEASGGFDPYVRRGQETELHLRLYLDGFDFEYHPQVCFRYRQHRSPSRISVHRTREDHFHRFEHFEQLVRRAEQGPRKANLEYNKIVLGQNAWRIARRRLRYGERDRAARFFAEAIRLGGHDVIFGHPFYKFLAKWTNPFFAEQVSGFVSKLRSRPTQKD